MPLGDYDDSLLVVGSRLVRAGMRPYLDFYSHYGPLGYTLFGGLMELVGNSGLALRIAQGVLLSLFAVLVHLATRRSGANPDGDEGLAPIAVLVFSGVAAFPSVLGFAAATAATLFFAIAVSGRRGVTRTACAVAGGVLLAVAALIRPSFGLYVAAAMFLSMLLLAAPGETGFRGRLALFGALVGGSLATGLLLWLLLYRGIPAHVLLEATLLVPSRLISGGSRYLDPAFLSGPPVQAVAATIALAAANSIWILALPRREAKPAWLLGAGVVALLPLALRLALPGKPLPVLGYLYSPLAFLVAFVHRKALRRDGALAAAAVVGLAAGAYLHYFWSRADGPHLMPAFALAAIGAGLIWGRLPDAPRLAAIGVLALLYGVAARGWFESVFPVLHFSKTKVVRTPLGLVVPCERLPEDPARAAALADRLSRPTSRFVAVASSHVASQLDPVVLFAASRRLPYTRWFQYDPGLQSSAAVQREMERELTAADSEAAVVWRADRFLVDRERPAVESKTPFDAAIERIYPHKVASFGDYKVRVRTAPRAPAP